MVKKKLCLAIITTLMVFCLAGCGNKAEQSSSAQPAASSSEKVESAAKTEETPSLSSNAETVESTAAAESTAESTEADNGRVYADPPASDWEYQYDAALEGLYVYAYTGIETAVRFPEEIDGDPVKKLKVSGGWHNAKYVEIPDTITWIDDEAFSRTGIRGIKFPDGINYIGTYAFANSGELEEFINFPESLEGVTVGEGAFLGMCKDNSVLDEITIPASWGTLGKQFYYSGVKKIILSDGITEIAPEALWQCENLKEIIIPDSVKKIGYGAFFRCRSLRNLELPDDIVLELGRGGFDSLHWPFDECEALTVTYKGQKYNYTNFDELYSLFE